MRGATKFASQVIAWFRAHQRPLPWRQIRDPYAIWVSEIMLQQTQVKTVIPYWGRWMRELPTVGALAEAAPERVLKLWEGLGYYSRARNLQKAAQQVVRDHDGVFPSEFGSVLKLPGIGRYTAGAIASIAFGEARPIVDGNVARVLARTQGVRGDPKCKETSAVLWGLASELVEAAHARDGCSDLNQGLMELGATVCLPRAPLCGQCPVRRNCYARINNEVERFPETTARVKSTKRTFRAALILKDGKILMRKRPEGVVNAGFWEMPVIEVGKESVRVSLQSLLGTSNVKSKRVCVIKHTITRYRMNLEVFRTDVWPEVAGNWLKIEELSRWPLVNAHRKALDEAGLLFPPNTQTGKNLMEKVSTEATV